MRICIISDLHANLEALSALPNDYEELWVLGDLVNYGPDPAATIDFVRSRASTIIRGNHDHSVGFGVDCGCSPRFRAMAEATREYTASVLSAADKQFLRYEYRPPASPLWDREEEASLGANFVLVGHTHLQFSRTARQQTIVNPGSLGQSKAGDPRARYAIWQDGRLELCTINYPVETTATKIYKLPLPEEIKSDLATVLRTGVQLKS